MLYDPHFLTSLFSQPPFSPEETRIAQAKSKTDSVPTVDWNISDVPALASKLSLLFSNEWLITAPLATNLFTDTDLSSISPDMLTLSCLSSPLNFNTHDVLQTSPASVEYRASSPEDSEPLKENIDPKHLQTRSQTTNSIFTAGGTAGRSASRKAQSQKQLTLRVRRNAVFVSREYFEQVLSTSCPEVSINADPDDEHECSLHSEYDSDNSCNVANDISDKGKREKLTLVADQTTSKGYDHRINNILYGWLERNRSNPYPTTGDKRWLMDQTGLSKMQLKNWFCNVRRRKLGSLLRKKISSAN
ncbi:Homeobox protein tos8 [Coemansia sp. RSA 485]|nr:Homeobox protein tos8 [Coemansia sp. RSA 485]